MNRFEHKLTRALAAMVFAVMFASFFSAPRSFVRAAPNLLKLGDKGDQVRELQQLLYENGFDPGPIDGVFGRQTEQVLRSYQQAAGLRIDGIAGPLTKQSLKTTRKIYYVQPGDNLTLIAKKFNVEPNLLIKLNKLSNPNQLFVRQEVIIPTIRLGQTSAPAKSQKSVTPSQASESSKAKPSQQSQSKEAASFEDLKISAPQAVLPKFSGAQPPLVQPAVIALTFNDGPDPTNTPKVLKILTEAKVPATFFVIGSRVAQYPDIVKQIAVDGHEIENHTYSHSSLLELPNNEISHELQKTNDLIFTITGIKPKYLRPPGGRFDYRIIKVASQNQLQISLWNNAVTTDQTVNNPKLLAQALADIAFSGSVLMLHDTSEVTVEALPILIEMLKSRGFTFKLLSQVSSKSLTAFKNAALPLQD